MAHSMIIDCSMTMAWCFEDEQTDATIELRNRMIIESAAVPSIWPLEVTNVLAMAEKRKRITVADTTEFLELLGRLQIELDADSSSRVFEHVLPLARFYKLTTYDASYLELALRRQLPLASLDQNLRSAAALLGIPLLGI